MGLRRRGRHERTDAPPRLDHPRALELRVDPCDRVGVDPQIDRELTDGRKLVARAQPVGGNRGTQPTLQLSVDGRGVVRVDGDESHDAYCTSTNVQINRNVVREPSESRQYRREASARPITGGSVAASASGAAAASAMAGRCIEVPPD